MTFPTHRILTHLLFLFLLVHTSNSQTFEQPTIEEANNATTFLSNTRPLARALTAEANLLQPLIAHISFVSEAVTTSARAAQDKSDDTDTPVTTICNKRQGDQWNADVRRYFQQLSWGVFDDGCVTDVYGAGLSEAVGIVGSNQPGSTSRQVFEAVIAHARGLDEIAKDAAGNAGLTWDAATRGNSFEYSVRTQKCVHDYAGFVRRGGEWFVCERVTNVEKDLNVGEDARLYMQEYLRLDNGRIISATVSPRKNDDEDTFEFENGTTVLTKSNGAVTGSEFGSIFATDNLAVREALRAGEHNTQQASDATTPSNIAILALPLAMNVVPVALIADVNTAGMLVYTLLTDILTTIPLLIKGVEVLAIGVDTNVAVVTRVTGANIKDDSNKAGEVWVAECRANGDLTATGVALIVVAVGFMVGGVIAEIVAQKWVKKRGAVAGGKTSAGLVMAGVVGRGKVSDASKNV